MLWWEGKWCIDLLVNCTAKESFSANNISNSIWEQLSARKQKVQCEGPHYGALGGFGGIPQSCSDCCGLSGPAHLGNQAVLGLANTGMRDCLAILGIVGKKQEVQTEELLHVEH